MRFYNGQRHPLARPLGKNGDIARVDSNLSGKSFEEWPLYPDREHAYNDRGSQHDGRCASSAQCGSQQERINAD